eukprot:16440382-Heterocapsa_arctica.AAC.2
MERRDQGCVFAPRLNAYPSRSTPRWEPRPDRNPGPELGNHGASPAAAEEKMVPGQPGLPGLDGGHLYLPNRDLRFGIPDRGPCPRAAAAPGTPQQRDHPQGASRALLRG